MFCRHFVSRKHISSIIISKFPVHGVKKPPSIYFWGGRKIVRSVTYRIGHVSWKRAHPSDSMLECGKSHLVLWLVASPRRDYFMIPQTTRLFREETKKQAQTNETILGGKAFLCFTRNEKSCFVVSAKSQSFGWDKLQVSIAKRRFPIIFASFLRDTHAKMMIPNLLTSAMVKLVFWWKKMFVMLYLYSSDELLLNKPLILSFRTNRIKALILWQSSLITYTLI